MDQPVLIFLLLYCFPGQKRFHLCPLFVENTASVMVIHQEICVSKRREERGVHRFSQRSVFDIHVGVR